MSWVLGTSKPVYVYDSGDGHTRGRLDLSAPYDVYVAYGGTAGPSHYLGWFRHSWRRDDYRERVAALTRPWLTTYAHEPGYFMVGFADVDQEPTHWGPIDPATGMTPWR